MKKIITTVLCFFVFANAFVFAQMIPQYNHFALEHLKRSLEFLLQSDYQNAVISSNQLIRIDPNSALNYVIRARALFELSEFDMVITDTTQAIRLDRNNAAAFLIRGNAHGRKGDYNRAISDWQAALRINPDIDEASHNIDVARRTINNRPSAKSDKY